jgi:hypothetical protein
VGLREPALEIAASVRSLFVLSRVARTLRGFETKHAYGFVLEKLASGGAISRYRNRAAPSRRHDGNSTSFVATAQRGATTMLFCETTSPAPSPRSRRRRRARSS